MIPGSRSRATLAAFLALLVLDGTAAAQTGDTPRDLLESRDGAVRQGLSSGPVRLTPRRSDTPGQTPDADAGDRTVTPTPKSGIQVEGLSAIDPSSVGSLTEAEGAFPTDMWSGTPRAVIERLLPKIPSVIPSPVLRDLARRLLLSAAGIPPRDGPAADQAAGKTAPLDLIVARISLLQAMGNFKEARELIELTPGRGTNSRLLRLQAQDRLYAGDYGGACQIVQAAGPDLARTYWQRLLAYCQALQGDTAGASFGASLLAESEATRDVAFSALIDRLTRTAETPLDSLPEPTPLHLAMLRTAKMTIPEDAVAATSPAVLKAVGISPNARLEMRLAAAERATEFGALSHERLAEIYMAVKFEPNELNNALSLAAADRSARGRALLFQAAQIESVAMARAAVISKAFEIAGEDGRFLQVIRLYRSLIADLPPSADMVWFASEAARTLYALDRPLPARPWVEELRLAASRNDEYQSPLDGLWFLGLLTDSGVSPDDLDIRLAAWRAYHREAAPDRARMRIAAGLRLLEALGYGLAEGAWWDLLDAPQRRSGQLADPALAAAMRHAAEAGRFGETVLLALLLLGNEEPGIADLDTVVDTVLALRRIGLGNEARLLAVEAAAIEGL